MRIDNAGAQELATNSGYSQRTKHIDIRYHFLREVVANGQVLLESCSSKENVANLMTKPLNKDLFEEHRRRMGVLLRFSCQKLRDKSAT